MFRFSSTILALTCLNFFVNFSFSSEAPVVTTLRGDLRPKILSSRDGHEYSAFLGIPYATPPVNNLRYNPPTDPMPWSGIRNATEFSPKCIQYNILSEKVEGQEDCLYLNVFTRTKNIPTVKKGKSEAGLLPVMIFFQPGAYNFDTCENYGADYIMDEEVVLVTFNFRLGSFGFLNTGDYEIQGNMGMKDQVAVLKWVQTEIAHFGGDKNQVTLFGDRSGGSSVHYHMISKLSKNLFRFAISQSGTALCPYAFDRNPRRSAKKLGTLLNCPTSNTQDLAHCLRSLDARIIAGKQAEMYEWGTDPIAPFAPSVESVLDEQSVFLLDTPYRLIQTRQVSEIPWIVGVDDKFGLHSAETIVSDPRQTEELNQDWHRIAPHAFYFRDTALEPDAISHQIQAFYFAGKPISRETRENLTSLYSDRLCNHCSRVGALLLARQNENNPVFLYQMAYVGQFSLLSHLNVTADGVSEGDYLHYLFNMDKEDVKTEKDIEFSKNLIKLWTSFAAKGEPEATWGSEKKWKPISTLEVKGDRPLKYYQLNSETKTIDESYTDRMTFWDNLPINEYDDEVISPYSRGNIDENFDEIEI